MNLRYKRFPTINLVLISILFFTNILFPYQSSITKDRFVLPPYLQSDADKSDSTQSKNNVKDNNNITTLFIEYDSLNNDYRIINKDEYDFDNFRYFGDIFGFYFPAFLNDFGIFGQPHGINFYGLNAGSISASLGGITIDEPYTAVIPFYRFQTNDIQSVILHHLPSGFVYGDFSRTVNITFIPYEEYSKIPHTRIFYSQAPNDEATINIYFHKPLSRKIFFTFDLGNAIISSNYQNSDYENWNGSARLNYLPDSTMNIALLFTRYRAITQLNGGVDFDSVENIDGNFNELFYNGYIAPVNYTNRKMTQEMNNYALFIKKKINPYNKLNFKLSYADYYTKVDDKSFEFPLRRKTDTYSLKFSHNFDNEKLFISESFGYSLVKNNDSFKNRYFAIEIGTRLFNRKFNPKLFGRSDWTNNKFSRGYGLGFSFLFTKKITVFSEASLVGRNFDYMDFYDEAYSVDTHKQKIFTAESGVNLATENIRLSASGFIYLNDNKPFFYYSENFSKLNRTYGNHKIFGFHLNGKFIFPYIRMKFNLSLLNNKLNSLKISPTKILNVGLFYVNEFFNNNLLMKTGLNLYLTDGQNYFERDFFLGRNIWFYENNQNNILPFDKNGSQNSFSLDFFFAGEIQKNAIVYFILENITDNKYFIVPYYPKQSRGFRIGISWDLFN